MEKLSKTPLEAAIEYLGATGKIKRDKEVAEALGMSKGTLSAYKSGRTEPSESFIKKFENRYSISLKDFQIFVNKELFDSQVKEVENRRNAGDHQHDNIFFHVPIVWSKDHASYLESENRTVLVTGYSQFQLLPGFNPEGAVWRYWEIDGQQMEPVLSKHDVILTSQVNYLDWGDVGNYGLYVFVTFDKRILIKKAYYIGDFIDMSRVYQLDFDYRWVLISENESVPQEILKLEDISEIWLHRGSLIRRALPRKEIPITAQ